MLAEFVLAQSLLLSSAVGQHPQRVFDEFEHRISQYLELREATSRRLPEANHRSNPAEIEQFRTALAVALQDARRDARPGNLFPPEMQPVLLRLIRCDIAEADWIDLASLDLDGTKTIALNESLADHAPAGLPARMLVKLPLLHGGLTYRVVGNRLVLRDMVPGIVVDFIPEPLVPAVCPSGI